MSTCVNHIQTKLHSDAYVDCVRHLISQRTVTFLVLIEHVPRCAHPLQEDEIARLIRSYDKASDTNVGSLFCGEYLKACPLVGDGGEGAGASTDSHGGDL